ncbi:hypothetical protein D3C81_668370 [compost metagenome]
MGLDHFGARAQPQVEGIPQNHLRADSLDVARQHALDRAIGAHGHERRGFDHTPRERQAAAAGLAISGQQFKGHTTGATHA